MPLPVIAASIARGAASLAAAAGEAAATVGRGMMRASQAAGTSLNPLASAIGMGGGAVGQTAAPTFARSAAAAQSAVSGVGQGMAPAAKLAQQAVTTVAAAPPAVTAAGPTAAPGQAGFFSQLKQQIAQGVAQAIAGRGQNQGQMLPPGTQPQQQGQQSYSITQLVNMATHNVRNLAAGGPSIAGAVRSVSTGDKTVDSMKDLAITVVTLPAILRDFGSSVLDAKRGLAEYNGQIGNALVKLDFSRTARNIEFGQMTGDSTAKLAEAQDRLERELIQYGAAATNTLNHLLTAVENGAAFMINALEAMSPRLAEIVRNLGEKSEEEESILNKLAMNLATGATVRSLGSRRRPPGVGSIPGGTVHGPAMAIPTAAGVSSNGWLCLPEERIRK